MKSRPFQSRRTCFAVILAVCAFFITSDAFAQYMCSVTYRQSNGNLINPPAQIFSSPQQCQAMTNSAAAQNKLTSFGCRCQSLQPQPVNNPSVSVNPVPAGPTPEERQKEAEAAAARAEAKKKADFVRDRDSTALRDAVGSGSSNGIRDADGRGSGSTGEIRDSNGAGNGIRDNTTMPGKSESLGALKSMAGSEADADCRFDKGGCVPVALALIPRVAMTARTQELLLHVPPEAQNKPEVIAKLNDFDKTDRDRLQKQQKLVAVEKQIAAGSVIDMADAKKQQALLKEQVAMDVKKEDAEKQDMKGDPEVGWIETPPSNVHKQ